MTTSIVFELFVYYSNRMWPTVLCFIYLFSFFVASFPISAAYLGRHVLPGRECDGCYVSGRTQDEHK